MLELKVVNKVRRELSALSFDVKKDAAERTDSELKYLAHYSLADLVEIGGVQHRMGYFESSGFHIACHYWQPKKPVGTVFVLHGYFDHSGLYGNLFRYLLEKNYAVVAIDLPGHGLSSGERISIDSFDRYTHVLAELLERSFENLPQPWNAVGQSTGGAILMKYLLSSEPHEHRALLQKVSLLSPLVRPVQWWARRLFYLTGRGLIKGFKRKFYPSSHNEIFNRFIRYHDPLQDFLIPIPWLGAMKRWGESFANLLESEFPLTVVQGDCDNTVDWRHNMEAIQQRFPNANIHLVRGARHQLVNEIPVLRDKIFPLLDL